MLAQLFLLYGVMGMVRSKPDESGACTAGSACSQSELEVVEDAWAMAESTELLQARVSHPKIGNIHTHNDLGEDGLEHRVPREDEFKATGVSLAGGVRLHIDGAGTLLGEASMREDGNGSDAGDPSYSRENGLFRGGDDGYHSYRIPSLVHMGGGRLIAFAEARVKGASDWGDVDVVYRMSGDNGKTWSGVKVLFGTDADTWRNPTAVYEEPNRDLKLGRLHLVFNTHPGEAREFKDLAPGDCRTFYTYSDDQGNTFADPVDLTEDLAFPGMPTWDAVGPGTGIVKTIAPNEWTIVIPATGRNFLSKDHGRTWWYEMVADSDNITTGESTVVECPDGSLWRNDRPTGANWEDAKRRWTTRGYLGKGFPPQEPFGALRDPRAHASILRFPHPDEDMAVFLNSDSTVNRRKMKPKLIHDCGRGKIISGKYLYVNTPPDFFETIDEAIDAGKGGYSSMAFTADSRIAALVETNDKFIGRGDHQSIDFHKFGLDFILAK